MQLSNYRFSDYRLAAYVVAAAMIAGGVTFAFDRLTAPTSKVEANRAPGSSGAVRQISIARTSAADLGDPENKLTPVYPTSPGKDLPIKDAPVVQATKTPVAATTGIGGGQTASTPAAPATAIASASTAPANACNVAACASAYRSFREADCSYQPLSGPRRLCEGTADTSGQVATRVPAQQQSRVQYDTNSTRAVGRTRYDDELRDDDDSGVTVIETPRQRYDLRRNWISEPQD